MGHIYVLTYVDIWWCCYVVKTPKKPPGSLVLCLAHYHTQVAKIVSEDRGVDRVSSSALEEAALELLLGVGLDREQTLYLMDHQPDQSSSTSVPYSQRFEAGQSIQPTSTFE